MDDPSKITDKKTIMQTVEKHISAVDEKSINYYMQNRVCGKRPEFPCIPRFFLPNIERMSWTPKEESQ